MLDFCFNHVTIGNASGILLNYAYVIAIRFPVVKTHATLQFLLQSQVLLSANIIIVTLDFKMIYTPHNCLI